MLKDRNRDRVPRDKLTLLTGNISKITVDTESSCAINEKASDTTYQATSQRSNDLDEPTSSQSCQNSFIVSEQFYCD